VARAVTHSCEQKSDYVIMVALNAHAAAMIGVGRRHCETKEQDMPRSADAQGFRNLKTTAISQDECELAAIGLAVALGATCAVCAQLAARSRLQATIEPTYQMNAKAAFLHAAARSSTRHASSWIPGWTWTTGGIP
jgi:hypothetical protein